MAASAAGAAADPPAIVPWHQVGSAAIGASQSAVEAAYGKGKKGFRYNRYALHGGHLTIQYDASAHVNGITVEDTAYYRAPGGFRVGFRIPRGACHERAGVCHYTWNGLDSTGGGTWSRTLVWNGLRLDVFVEATAGKVQSFAIAELGRAGVAVAPTAAARKAIVTASKKAWCGPGPCSAAVSRVRLSRTDRTYAADLIEQKGAESAVAVLHRSAGAWKVIDLGSDQIGCGKAPRGVLDDLSLYCG